MATIQFKALGIKNPVNLNVRFYHNKINCYAKSNIFLNLHDWNSLKDELKKTAPAEVKNYVNEVMQSMSKHIIASFSRDFPIGEKITTIWLKKEIDEFYSKPDGENDYRYYFTPYVAKYIEESRTRINPVSGKLISPRTIQNYNTTLKRLKEFEDLNGKWKTKNVNLDFHKKFTSFLKISGNYSGTVVEKYISHIKNFVKEAKVEGYETSIEIESRKFTFKRDETFDTYLNKDEINLIYNLDLSNNSRLDNARDLMIAGLWTGLRISDLHNFNTFKISENRIKILETEKTGTSVEIPLHSHLKAVLNKRNSQLPQLSSQNFNSYIKEICQLAGIVDVVIGSIKDPQTNRKVRGYYPKFKLISSHSLRRSFATNLAGQIPDRTIMAITTHKSYNQFQKYIKTTQEQFADQLQDHWDKEETRESNLKIV